MTTLCLLLYIVLEAVCEDCRRTMVGSSQSLHLNSSVLQCHPRQIETVITKLTTTSADLGLWLSFVSSPVVDPMLFDWSLEVQDGPGACHMACSHRREDRFVSTHTGSMWRPLALKPRRRPLFGAQRWMISTSIKVNTYVHTSTVLKQICWRFYWMLDLHTFLPSILRTSLCDSGIFNLSLPSTAHTTWPLSHFDTWWIAFAQVCLKCI